MVVSRIVIYTLDGDASARQTVKTGVVASTVSIDL